MENAVKKENFAYLSFTERGRELANRLCTVTGGRADFAGKGGVSLRQWTEEQFAACDVLVFVGAVGICVRAIAPFIQNKTIDPAVLCIDEGGNFVIPLLSGHLGGANAVARRLAALCSAVPVITTATDLNGVFAVDLWAKAQNLAVVNPERIKSVSSKILSGQEIQICCPWPVSGTVPDRVTLSEEGDVAVGFHDTGREKLLLAPKTGALGIGCRKNIMPQQLEEAFLRFCAERKLLAESVSTAATIDLKASEPGLLEFINRHGWPLKTYSAGELAAVPGSFTASPFVEKITGVDNVCERASVLACSGELLEKKYACGGVTFAFAAAPPELNWRTDDGEADHSGHRPG